jgi:cephalosporin hydroxylase
MNEIELFNEECKKRIESYPKKEKFQKIKNMFMQESADEKYPYNFLWLGRPIIQYPQDIIAMQELIWTVKPDLIIETGIAHGGSLVFSASMLALLEISKAIKKGKVLGIDIDIKAHNRLEVEKHPLSKKIEMLQGSSIDKNIIKRVYDFTKSYKKIFVCLDSNHTHKHVLAELNAYGPLVSKGSYCIVFDTFIEDLPDGMITDRPWGKKNNPKTAVWEYLKSHPEFKIDKNMEKKLLITTAPDGFLKKTK